MAASSALIAQSNSQPVLSIGLGASNTVTLSWSNSPPGYVLEQSTTLPGTVPITVSSDGFVPVTATSQPAVLWQGVLSPPSSAGNILTVVQPATNQTVFYRLVAKGNPAGFAYLEFTQGGDGLWGSGTQAQDTFDVIEALADIGETNSLAYGSGLAAMETFSARNNDELSRQIIDVSLADGTVSNLTAELSGSQNAEVTSSSITNYPGRGWGLASGFDTSTIDTALALRALAASSDPAGLGVVNETLPASTGNALHNFSVPAGATGLALKVRALKGTVLFQINYPGGGDSYISLSSSQTPITVNFPTASGNLSLLTSNQTATAASYTVEVGYAASNNSDSFSITTPLTYLGLAQNSDGGWGIVPGQASQLMITVEIIRALGSWSGALIDSNAFSNATTWLLAHQNSDGGFSSTPGASDNYETSLAVIGLKTAAPGIYLSNAAAYLQNAELSDGSWGSDPVQTALALEALHNAPFVAQIPSQSVLLPAPFTNINLNSYVTEPGLSSNQITWQVTGTNLISVTISNGIASFVYPPETNVSENLTFTATDPNGSSASSTATFTATYQLVNYIIAQGGSTNDSQMITGDPSVLNQAAAYTWSGSNIPPGVTYTTTSFSRTSANAFTVGYNIAAAPSATPGIYSFGADYGLLNSTNGSLGPLTNNIFSFTIEIVP